MIKHIIALEKVQKMVTKYILSDFSLDYKSEAKETWYCTTHVVF